MRGGSVQEYTLKQFLAAADITWPTWSKWVEKGVAPRHYRIGKGRNIRLSAEEWSRWFELLESDRRRVGRPYLLHPLQRRAKRAPRGNASAGTTGVAARMIQPAAAKH
jgi:hypothetical protein